MAATADLTRSGARRGLYKLHSATSIYANPPILLSDRNLAGDTGNEFAAKVRASATFPQFIAWTRIRHSLVEPPRHPPRTVTPRQQAALYLLTPQFAGGDCAAPIQDLFSKYKRIYLSLLSILTEVNIALS